ncbi:MAG: response regulator [bacterium]
MENIRVLLIDDEEELVSTQVERLAIRNIEAEYVMSGPEAIKRLGEKEFDIAVLDYMLPGMSGVSVVRAIHEQFPRVKILLVTGHLQIHEDQKENPDIENIDVLIKPIGLDVLISKLQEIVQRG